MVLIVNAIYVEDTEERNHWLGMNVLIAAEDSKLKRSF